MASDQQLENLSPVKRALYEIRQLRIRVQELERLRTEPVAIIGLGLRFPGNASTPEALWNVLASGVVGAAKELKFKVPVVVRMEGTNVQQGKEILRNSGFNFAVAEGMKDGAEKAVALAGGAR